MIPLSQWLNDRGRRDAGQVVPSVSAIADDGFEASTTSPEEQAYARGREDERAELLACIEALRLDHQSELVRLEATLNARWENLVSAELSDSVTKAFDDLRRALDQSICEVLKPLLYEGVARQAAEQLMNHVRAEAGRSSAPIIEIRSPAALHARLEKVLSENGIAVSLCEGDVIEVTAKDSTSRFESMASRWIALLHEDDP